MEIKEKVQSVVSDVKLYWKTPPHGMYMTFKEVAAYSVGGIGAYFILTTVQAMMLSVGNFLIGNAIGIKPSMVYALYVVAVIASFPMTAIRANIIDNTRSKEGKYRPYLISMGIPTAILAFAFVWAPYEIMPYWAKCATVLVINIGFQFFYTFFSEAYENLLLVISPNTQERTNVASIKSVVQSLAPSIMNIIIPLAAKVLTDGSMTDMKLYRWVYPPMLIIGMLFSIVIYANTREKIIQAKTHVVQIKFLDALRAVAKNKYFWIISLASWLGFLEGSYVTILQWLYQYQKACTEGQYALIVTIYGNASLWGMLAAPWAVKRFGKKRVLLFTNFLNIVFIALMYPIIYKIDPSKCIWLILLCLWMNALVGAFGHILNPSINGDIRDYQQYVTGERIDGMFSTVGLIGSVFTLVTSGILPFAYDKGGINETQLAKDLPMLIEKGFIKDAASANVYDVLYDVNIFRTVIFFLIALSVVGAIMNVIPYFFYDLTELKQKAMVKVLRVRALFEDYGNDALSDDQLVEAIDLINEANSLVDAQPVEVSKQIIKDAKKTGDKAAVKAAKKAYRAAIEHNESIEISKFIVEEMRKFDNIDVQADLEVAKKIRAAGLNKLADVDPSVLVTAKALPSNTKEEKLYRKKEIESAKKRLSSKKLIAKYYPNGLVKFDSTIFDTLFAEEDKAEAALDVAYKALIEAKKSKDSEKINKYKKDIKEIKAARKIVRDKIKKVTDESSIYNRAAKPYLDAKRLMVQEENYKHFDEIAAMYDDAKQRAETARAEKEAEQKRLDAEKKAAKEKLKEDRHAKKK